MKFAAVLNVLKFAHRTELLWFNVLMHQLGHSKLHDIISSMLET